MSNEQQSGFHWRDRIYFEKDDFGNVTITQRDEIGLIKWQAYKIPSAEWASIISSCSQDGETSEKYQDALWFHTQKRVTRDAPEAPTQEEIEAKAKDITQGWYNGRSVYEALIEMAQWILTFRR